MLGFIIATAIGYIVTKLRCPVPAPITFESVLGVFGLYFGYCLANGVFK